MKPRPSVKTERVPKKWKTDKQHPHDKWVALRTKLLEDDINGLDLIHSFADFLRRVLPQPATQKKPQRHPEPGRAPKIEMVDMAETPKRVLVTGCRNAGLAAVAKMLKRPILMTMSEGSMRSRVPI